MNRCVRVCAGLIWGLGMVAVPAAAQVPTGPVSIPAGDKNVPDATPFRADIQKFIHAEMITLTGEDIAAQKSARDKLISECSVGSTPSYFDVYSDELNKEVLLVLNSQNPQLRIRLDIAVVVEGVARTIQGGQTVFLEPSVIKLISDPMDAISLWGMKAAKPTLVVKLNVQNSGLLLNDKLMPAIVAGVKVHPQFGYIAGEAYNALVPQPKGVGGNQIQLNLAPVFTPLLDLLDYRISIYTSQVVDQPSAEVVAVSFLKPGNLNAANRTERDRANQLLTNLIYVAGEQAPTASKKDLDQIITTLKYAAQQLNVILNNPAAQATLQPLFSQSPGTKGEAVELKTKVVPDVLKTIIPTLKAPPTVTRATTAPAV